MKHLLILGRFGVVGSVATGIHMLVVSLIITSGIVPVLVANLIAFLTAFCFSFYGNYYWTFSSPGFRGRALRRFFLISASAFAVNTFVLATLLTTDYFSPTSSALVAATVIPVITFLLSRNWGFKK